MVFVLWHTSLSEDHKLIGIFDEFSVAWEAMHALKDKPGFRDRPDGFEVERYVLDEIHWQEGFVTV